MLAALLALAGAIGVVTSRQPIRSALWLVLALTASAVCYLGISASFAAAAQVVVYVGAIVVLSVIGWLLGKVPGAAWNRWDDDARVASRRDAPVRIGPGGFTGRARASAAAILILLATLLWGWIADATSVPSLVQGVFVIG